MRRPAKLAAVVAATVVTAAGIAVPAVADTKATTNIKYDVVDETSYDDLWVRPYGDLQIAEGAGGTLEVNKSGIEVDATPFTIGADFSVFDHLKYLAISTEEFEVPAAGSLEFSVDIMASTPGTEEGRVIDGCYGPPFSYGAVGDPCDEPYSEEVLQGQQASASLNMINFATGQLFDWLVSEDRAIALIERLPTTVTGSPGTPVEKAYTQIVTEVPIKPGKAHNYGIRYTRGPDVSVVEYFLDGTLVTSVENVGIPLDVQGVPFSGYAPSLGDGEELRDELDSFVIGHGLFSLLDAFPYQHPDAPELSVSIPMSERLFGQGAVGSWDKFKVKTKVDG
jgi:hypothetical protein